MKGGDEIGRKRRRRGSLVGVIGILAAGKIRSIVRALFQARVRPIGPTKADHIRALAVQMTEQAGSENEWATPPHDPEGIPWRKVAVITVIALSLYTIGTILAWFQLMYLQAGRQSTIPELIGMSRINMLIQPLFDLETAAYEQHHRERLRLSSYGWADRESGMIHIPVERAMEELLAEQERKPLGEGEKP